MPKKTILFLSFLLLRLAAGAQNLPADSALTRVLQSDVLLPLLIDSAIKNSPDIRRLSKNIALYEQNLQTTKKSVLNSVTLVSSYVYGSGGSFLYEKDQININPSNTYSNITTSRYNVGVSVQLPLGNFLSRKNATRTSQLQIEMAEDDKENTELFVKQQVIKLYQDLRLAHAILLTTSKMKQSAYISTTMAQKNFADGQITVEQISKLQNEYNQTIMDFDTQTNKFQTSFLMLEAYTGVQLTKLINRIR